MLDFSIFKKYLFLIILIAPIEIIGLNAKDKKTADTLLYKKNEVIIQAEKSSDSFKSIAPSALINISQAIIIFGDKIESYLKSVAGLSVKDFGGSGMKTLNIRGMNANQSGVFIDGIRINSEQNSVCDLSILPSSFFSTASLKKNSSDGNGLGGLYFESGALNKSSSELNISYSSFGNKFLSQSISTSIFNAPITLGWELDLQKNNYTFDFSKFDENSNKIIKTQETRENAKSDKISLYAKSNFDISDWNANSLILISDIERGSPGAVMLNVLENSLAKWDESVAMGLFNFEKKEFIFFDKANIDFSVKYDKSRYSDANDETLKEFNGENIYKSWNSALSLRLFKSIDNYEIKTSLELGENYLKGDLIKNLQNGSANRFTSSLAMNILRRDYLYPEALLTTNLNASFDNASDVSNNYSYSGGFTFNLALLPIELNAFYTRAYRLPNFNELYYFNYGNTELKPETSNSINLGIKSQLFDGIEFSGAYYLIYLQDQIISVPKSQFIYTAKNFSKTKSNGFELEAKAELLSKKIFLTLNYSNNKTIDNENSSQSFGKYLPYTPRELMNIGAIFNVLNSDLSLACSHSGYMYSALSNAPEMLIKSNTLFRAAIQRELFKSSIGSTNIKLECDNIFDLRYERVQYYPMPRRSFSLKVFVKAN